MNFNQESLKSSGDYIKLKDKESVVGVFYGDPKEYYQHWVSGKSSLCKGRECPECAQKIPASFRFSVGFITKEKNKDGVEEFTKKIFQQGKEVYRQMFNLSQDYDLNNWVVRITRSGSTQQDTSYAITPLPKGEPTKEFHDFVATLGSEDPMKKEYTPSTDESFSYDDIPFQGLNMNENKLLNIDQVAEMLGLKVSKIRDMIFKKQIPIVRIGRLVRFPEKAILKWLNEKIDASKENQLRKFKVRRLGERAGLSYL